METAGVRRREEGEFVSQPEHMTSADITTAIILCTYIFKGFFIRRIDCNNQYSINVPTDSFIFILKKVLLSIEQKW